MLLGLVGRQCPFHSVLLRGSFRANGKSEKKRAKRVPWLAGGDGDGVTGWKDGHVTSPASHPTHHPSPITHHPFIALRVRVVYLGGVAEWGLLLFTEGGGWKYSK